MWYKQLYELPPDRAPGPETMENDVELDEWWERFLTELKVTGPQNEERAGQKSVLAKYGGNRTFAGRAYDDAQV